MVGSHNKYIMKKLIISIFIIGNCFPAFAQPEKTAVELATGKIGTEIARQTEQAALQSARAIENATRGIENALYTVERVNTVQVLENTPVVPPHIQQLADLPGAPTVKLGGRVDNAPAVLSAPALSDAVQQTAQKSLSQTDERMAQIANLPGKPTIWVRLPHVEDTDVPILSARIIKPSELHENISLVESLQLYMPDAFYVPGDAAYRGMRLDDMDDLKNLLANGLETSHTAYDEGIYAANSPAVALSYAIPSYDSCIYESFLGGEFPIPVITKIPLTKELLQTNAPGHSKGWLVFGKDLPKEMISDVIVFLEIDGKPDWYRVTLEQEKIFFTPAPSSKVPGHYDTY